MEEALFKFAFSLEGLTCVTQALTMGEDKGGGKYRRIRTRHDMGAERV